MKLQVGVPYLQAEVSFSTDPWFWEQYQPYHVFSTFIVGFRHQNGFKTTQRSYNTPSFLSFLQSHGSLWTYRVPLLCVWHDKEHHAKYKCVTRLDNKYPHCMHIQKTSSKYISIQHPDCSKGNSESEHAKFLPSNLWDLLQCSNRRRFPLKVSSLKPSLSIQHTKVPFGWTQVGLAPCKINWIHEFQGGPTSSSCCFF